MVFRNRSYRSSRSILFILFWGLLLAAGAFPVPSVGDVVLRINAGGPEVAAIDGGPVWEADTQTAAHPTRNAGSQVAGGTVSSFDASVDLSTTPEGVFGTERWDPSSAPAMQWDIPLGVANGSLVEVRLYFANTFSGTSAPGQRVFDVSVDGTLVLDDYDIIPDVGDQTGVMKSFTVPYDGNLDIDFAHVVENPLINAIEIFELTPQPVVSLSPDSLDFGLVVIGDTSPTQSIAVENTGSAPLDITSIAVAGGDFGHTHTCTTSLAVGASCSVEVWFEPSAVGSQTGTLEIFSNAASSPDGVSLNGEGVATPVPVLSVSPSSLSFGDVTVDETSMLSVAVGNIGTAALDIASITISGGQFSHTHTCSSPLAVGASCTVEVSFEPTVVGGQTGTLTVDTSGGVEDVALAGTGVDTPVPGPVLLRINAGGPEVAAIDGGPVWEADTQTAAHPTRNAGSQVAGGTVSSFDASVDLSTTPEGVFGTERWDPSSAPAMQWDIPLGVANGSLVEVRLYFANTFSGTSAPGQRVFDVSVDGTLVLDDYDIIPDVGDQTGVMKSFTVPYDGNLDIDFAHVVENPLINAIEIFELTPQPVVSLSPDSLDFGLVVIGDTSPTQSIAVENTGSAPLDITSIAVAGGDFGHTHTCTTSLAVGASCSVEVWFEPSAVGSQTGTLEIFSNAASSPDGVSLNGEGVATPVPVLSVSPSSLSFGDVTVDETSMLSVAVGNIGTAALDIASITISGGQFSHTHTCSSPLAVGASCTVEVSFEPTVVGGQTGTLTVDTSGGVEDVALAGTGVDTPVPGPVLLRINAGGPEVAAIDGGPVWEADTQTAAHPTRNAGSQVAGGTVSSFDASVDLSTTPEGVFGTERWDPSSAPAMQWDIPLGVANGSLVEVRLYFANTFSGTSAPGQRVFDVSVDGTLVLDDYDIIPDVGDQTGVMKSFTVPYDGNLDIDFAHVVENPLINAIEVISTASEPNVLGTFPTAIDHGLVLIGSSDTRTLTLSNIGSTGDPTIDVTGTTIVGPNSSEWFDDFSGPLRLAPGEQTNINVTFDPSTVGSKAASLEVSHTGTNDPLVVVLSGISDDTTTVGFGASNLQAELSVDPTSLDFGPDGRLYVAQQDGLIYAYTIQRNSATDYVVTDSEQIDLVQNIVNHDDDGFVNTAITSRLILGILAHGSASNPVLYVTSSDSRISVGSDSGLDTNSGVLSRLTWTGTEWDHVQLVRGFPRSEENHAINGMDLDTTTNVLYLMVGGNTNNGAPSNNLAGTPEYALSNALVTIYLNDINAMDIQTEVVGGMTQQFIYDLPTIDDPTRTNNPDGSDQRDPWGGNNGLNQARMLTPPSPAEVYSTGYRNAYDVVLTSNDQLYTYDNGSNSGWGGLPINEGPIGNCTNELNEAQSVGGVDGLHYISGLGYYAGHPNPTRGNPVGSGLFVYEQIGGVWELQATYDWSDFPEPPVPFSLGDPVECDYRAPGIEDGALATQGASTNGIAEYTASNFGGALQGDLLAASFNGNVIRYKLNPAGDAVVLSENLLNIQSPLDVIALGDAGIFPGTIWTANHGSNTISVYEPNDFDPFPCTGADDATLDEDGDGFTNADEIDNGTNPCSAGSAPTDWDGDFISDLNDPDDDNDGAPDTTDVFALDPDDGLTNFVPAQCPANEAVSTTACLRFGNGSVPNTLLNLGFTGVMSNSVDDYASLFDADDLIQGGASPELTVQNTPAGDAFQSVNDQWNGFHFGVLPHTDAFTAHTRVAQPFPTGSTPTDFQSLGLAIGPGDQANYVKLVVAANGGNGGIELGTEINDTFSSTIVEEPSVIGDSIEIDLYLTIDPLASGDNVSASYSINGGALLSAGTTSTPSGWFDGTQAMAVGVISTSRGASPFPSIWGLLEVYQDDGLVAAGGAQLAINPNSSDLNASTFGNNSFQITNTSVGKRIANLTIDLSTAIFPDLVFDPDGTAGDTVAKGFTIDTDGGTGANGDALLLSPHGGDSDDGYDVIEISFSNFDPGETMGFSIDIDPTSIKGESAPGPNESGSVSGLELSGSTIVVEFDDTSVLTAQAFGDGSVGGSLALLQETPTTGLSSISFSGVPDPPATVTSSSQTLELSGPPNATVRVLVVEGGFFVNGGGYDPDPFEANSAIQVTYSADVMLDSSGATTVPLTLTNSDSDGGLNYVMATLLDDVGNATGPVAGPIVLELDQ